MSVAWPASDSPPSAGRLPSMVLVGRIGAAHGLKGEVRVKTLTTEPMAVARYTPLTDAG